MDARDLGCSGLVDIGLKFTDPLMKQRSRIQLGSAKVLVPENRLRSIAHIGLKNVIQRGCRIHRTNLNRSLTLPASSESQGGGYRRLPYSAFTEHERERHI